MKNNLKTIEHTIYFILGILLILPSTIINTLPDIGIMITFFIGVIFTKYFEKHKKIKNILLNEDDVNDAEDYKNINNMFKTSLLTMYDDKYPNISHNMGEILISKQNEIDNYEILNNFDKIVDTVIKAKSLTKEKNYKLKLLNIRKAVYEDINTIIKHDNFFDEKFNYKKGVKIYSFLTILDVSNTYNNKLLKNAIYQYGLSLKKFINNFKTRINYCEMYGEEGRKTVKIIFEQDLNDIDDNYKKIKIAINICKRKNKYLLIDYLRLLFTDLD